MHFINTALGIIGLCVSVFAILDNRRQRSEREKAVIAANAVIERVYGVLVGIKPGIIQTMPNFESAINDGLATVNEQRQKLGKL
ncbi:MAG: hypothetical protein WCF59_09900 [Desulfobaccales bacterium]